jgi:type 1 glutamine amidotransferase
MSLERRITRRAVCSALGFAGLGRGAGARTARAFALIGDEPHNSAYIRTGLTRTLVGGAGLSIDFTDQEKMLSYETLRQYKLFILFRDGYRWPNGRWRPVLSNDKIMITEQKDLVSVPPLPMKIGEGPVAWMTAEQGKAIKQWVLEGGSFFAYHNSSHVSLTNKDYRDVEGAVYTGHPVIRPFKVKIVNPDHPITKGVRDFVVTDEQHFMTYDKDPKYVLARSFNEDRLEYTDQTGRRSNTAEAAWAYDYGKGRVCFLAPGHMVTVLWNPEYEKMQKNVVKWLLRET